MYILYNFLPPLTFIVASSLRRRRDDKVVVPLHPYKVLELAGEEGQLRFREVGEGYFEDVAAAGLADASEEVGGGEGGGGGGLEGLNWNDEGTREGRRRTLRR